MEIDRSVCLAVDRFTSPCLKARIEASPLRNAIENPSAKSHFATMTNRSAYVQRIRKAFLLRSHPDRFRSEDASVRKRQASLMQALGDRFSSPDFLSYQASGLRVDDHEAASNTNVQFNGRYTYYLQRNDGRSMKHTIRLNDTVQNVLEQMTKALAASGVAGLPEPPPPPEMPTDIAWKRNAEAANATRTGSAASEFNRMHGIIWAASRASGGGTEARRQEIDHKYDVNSKRGSSLGGFLLDLNLADIEERKASRLDATAAALVARRAYGFQSIDGTGMGWSSASLAMLLSSLMALHDEHKSALQVESFYPMRLVISYDDDATTNVDLYGGVIRLHPAATPIQWLETLKGVTEESLAELDKNQRALRANAQRVQDGFNVKIKKGLTCPSIEYHTFAKRLATWLDDDGKSLEGRAASSAVALSRLQLVVEADQACRRARLNKDGSIRVGSGMDGSAIIKSLSRLSQEARGRVAERKEEITRAKEIIAQCHSRLGLLTGVPRDQVDCDTTSVCRLARTSLEDRHPS